MAPSLIYIRLIAVAILAIQGVTSEVQDLCEIGGCSCTPSPLRDDLIDVNCQCSSSAQEISWGPEDGVPSNNVALAPDSTVSLSFQNCQKVEILTQTFNSVPLLQNVSIQNIEEFTIHSRIYESRIGSGQSATISNFKIVNVTDLKVKRHSFEGIRVDGSFLLENVIVQRTPSLAFAFDAVKQFSIFGSRFDRVSMWGFKLDECIEFNALAKSRFFSLASQAMHMKCNKFMLTDNTFDNLHDSSLGLTYGLLDVQGNTFEKLTGKPFVDMRPILELEPNSNIPSGFVFRENKFACEPSLPFNAFAMPSFDVIDGAADSYVDIEKNHFACQCEKMDWFLGAMTHNFDQDVIANGRGSLEFLQKFYDTAGQCLSCGLRKCEVTTDQFGSFHQFAQNALMIHKGELKCSSSGRPLKSQKPGRQLNYTFSLGEEEGNASTRNSLSAASASTAKQNVFGILVLVALPFLRLL